jgi:hypothetical protein
VNVLSVECEPKESLGFWQSMGFAEFEKSEQSGSVQARRVLSRIFKLPSYVSPVNVMVAFYPESAIHGSRKTVLPMVEHRVVGVRADDASIMLGERIIGLSDYGSEKGDTVVKIEVEGIVHCFCKAKHEPAQLSGVQRDWLGGTYFIDTVRWNGPIE